MLTHKSAVHKDVVADLVDNLVHGKGFKASKEALEQAHLAEFHNTKSSYYNKLLWDIEGLGGTVAKKPEPKHFGSFDDPDGYNGFYPSDHFLKTVFLKYMEGCRVARLDKLVKGIEGEVKIRYFLAV